MRVLLLGLFISLAGISSAQSEFEVWADVGADGEVTDRLDWSVVLNSRFGNRGLNTLFPEAGLEYKVTKWFRPSIEYRYILDQDKYGNFGASHRINFNLNFKKTVDRLSLSGRARYQYGFDRSAGTDFNPDFDKAYRFKAGAKYDINDNIITPTISTELFYSPQFSQTTPGFTKLRSAIGFELDVKGPHSFSAKYQLDWKLNEYNSNKHVVAVSYGYSF